MAKEITRPTVQKSAAATARPVTPQERQIMICKAAYYIAEHRGFEPGHDVDDWLAAEQQIDAALTSPAPRAADSRL